MALQYSTQESSYTERLHHQSTVWWKRLFFAQAPYRWNLRRLEPGYLLDVGCGIGRNLSFVSGNGVGVDHNSDSVKLARSRGLQAFTPDEFRPFMTGNARLFDSMLLAHVIEHMPLEQAIGLVREYLPWVRPGGKLIVITPQEAGYASDPTHVQFMDLPEHLRLGRELGLKATRSYSFPLPRRAGRLFRHNELITVWEKPEN